MSIYFQVNIKGIVYKHRGLKIGRYIRRLNQKSKAVSVMVIVEAESEMVAGVAGSLVVVTGLTWQFPHGH